MIQYALITVFAAAFTLLGIFIAANNPAVAQRFKTNGTKLLEAAKAEAAILKTKLGK
jgi:hypothetical protein